MDFAQFEIDDSGRHRKGAWQQTSTGQKFFALDPREDEIHFDDICIGIAREGRYRNQTKYPYYVAEHSVIVSVYCEKFAIERGWPEEDVTMVAREGLFHDGSEAYLGDVVRPLKRQPEMKPYRDAEEVLQALIYKRFDIVSTPESAALVHEVDNRIVLDEIRHLMKDPEMWTRASRYVGMQPLGVDPWCLSWDKAQYAFCQRYAELWPEH